MDLTALTGRVRLAKNQRDTPPPPGGSKPLLLLDQYLTDDDWRLVRETVWALRREHGDTFALYTENALAVMLIDILASCDSAPALSQVANEIAALAEDEGPWLISTPLATSPQLSHSHALRKASSFGARISEPRGSMSGSPSRRTTVR